MTAYVMTCSSEWVFYGSPATAEKYPYCTGTLQSVPYQELNPSGLSAEDLNEYIGHVLILFAFVFGVLAVKKSIF